AYLQQAHTPASGRLHQTLDRMDQHAHVHSLHIRGISVAAVLAHQRGLALRIEHAHRLDITTKRRSIMTGAMTEHGQIASQMGMSLLDAALVRFRGLDRSSPVEELEAIAGQRDHAVLGQDAHEQAIELVKTRLYAQGIAHDREAGFSSWSRVDSGAA